MSRMCKIPSVFMAVAGSGDNDRDLIIPTGNATEVTKGRVPETLTVPCCLGSVSALA